jgi:hypothetical protein
MEGITRCHWNYNSISRRDDRQKTTEGETAMKTFQLSGILVIIVIAPVLMASDDVCRHVEAAYNACTQPPDCVPLTQAATCWDYCDAHCANCGHPNESNTMEGVIVPCGGDPDCNNYCGEVRECSPCDWDPPVVPSPPDMSGAPSPWPTTHTKSFYNLSGVYHIGTEENPKLTIEIDNAELPKREYGSVCWRYLVYVPEETHDYGTMKATINLSWLYMERWRKGVIGYTTFMTYPNNDSGRMILRVYANYGTPNTQVGARGRDIGVVNGWLPIAGCWYVSGRTTAWHYNGSAWVEVGSVALDRAELGDKPLTIEFGSIDQPITDRPPESTYYGMGSSSSYRWADFELVSN